ncbi:hypothetical protein [Rhodococcus sp. SMB37]|uniref:hypothetical protein n=1 Tax=Rhodococcus sp. SMB37 TaxID=2512213 RepID=UPI0010464C4D|nr:hypothetical protein [Rhodococcus sp. SMB37]
MSRESPCTNHGKEVAPMLGFTAFALIAAPAAGAADVAAPRARRVRAAAVSSVVRTLPEVRLR